jgi:hypothetical protein
MHGSLRALLQPSSVGLFALREDRGVPQVVSTSRHFPQGTLELDKVEWDAGSGVLRGVSLGPPGTDHHVAIYIPQAYAWAQPRPAYYYDFERYSTKLMQPDLLRLHVRVDSNGAVPWEVRFNKRL